MPHKKGKISIIYFPTSHVINDINIIFLTVNKMISNVLVIKNITIKKINK
jgi:hypothetical protein